MEDSQKKSKVGLIIAIVIGVLILLMIPVIVIVANLVGFIGGASKEIDKQLSNDDYNYSYNTTKNTNTKGRASTYNAPLKINEWGLASKSISQGLSKVYKDIYYIDVPVRITKVTRGNEGDKIVREWCDTRYFYKYEAPKADTEWGVFDYEVDLSDVTFDAETIGTDIEISSDITGLDGNSLKYNNKTYNTLSTTDITEVEYKKQPGVYKGRFIVTLPIGCKDYLVQLGNLANGAGSYFRVEE